MQKNPSLNFGNCLFKEIDSSLDANSAFLSLSSDPYPFFLDSTEGFGSLGGFSFTGANPFLLIESKNGHTTVYDRIKDTSEQFHNNPFSILNGLLKNYRIDGRNMPFPAGAAVGYFSYDLRHFVEKLPKTAKDDTFMPDLFIGFYSTILIFDHKERKKYIGACDFWHNGEKGRNWLEGEVLAFEERLNTINAIHDKDYDIIPARNLISTFTREGYIKAVTRCKEYIKAGDIFQVNLSQRFQADIYSSPLAIYQKLRKTNPAPFSAFIANKDWQILSSSPEMFLKVNDSLVRTRPIKGTRRCYGIEEADKQMRRELMESVKDGAELNMIIDLERNDIGRVCSYGTVNVTQAKVLEEYPTVYHLVGTIEGTLHEDKSVVDLIKACFPGGSITGAPKIRSMEIIEELEPVTRGPYTGSIGYIGFDGSAELNIAIRTMFVKDRKVYFNAGGGIVADSDPEAEYIETLHKARALIKTLGLEMPEG